MVNRPKKSRPRAFLTCSTRSRNVLSPILSTAEHLFLDLGWRTRVPRRAEQGTASLDERRRLRSQSYREIERSDLVLHVPAPASMAGVSMHRELNHAVRRKRPVIVLIAMDLRTAHEIEPPDVDRLDELARLCVGRVLLTLDELASHLHGWPSSGPSR